MRILITGGAGFIGSHTADALIEQGHSVRILDNLQETVHPKGMPDHVNPEAEFIQGDVRDKRSWEKALEGMEAVYHLAAYQDYLTDFSTFFHVNSVSTAMLYEVLVEQAAQVNVEKVIVAASQAVMGEGRYKCPRCYEQEPRWIYPDIRLEAQLSQGHWNHRCPTCQEILSWLPSDERVANPCNQYAISKFSQEQIALQLGKRYRIPTTVMRYSIVQGPRQSFYNAYSGAMRIFALSLMFDRQPIIYEDGHQIRDYVNIADVVDANVLVLEHPDADYRMFNVGGGTPWTVLDFYDSMVEITGKSMSPIIAGYYRYGDTRHIVSDIQQLGRLGWKPSRDVRDSIRQYWDYLHHQKDLDDILAYAETHMKQLQVIRQAVGARTTE